MRFESLSPLPNNIDKPSEAAENRYYKDLTVDVEEIIPEKNLALF
jgi:hypothetical protein